MEPGQPSRTAVFVCQGRAVADGRLALGQFADPVAEQLLTGVEREPVELARRGQLPTDARQRLIVESVLACAEVVVPRTVLIDAAISDALGNGGGQVVLLGAGLDARPWRLPALHGVPVFSVDHPDSQQDLQTRARDLPAPRCDLRYVAADLARQPLAPALAAAGHDSGRPTVWVWEGVIPYLSRQAVRTTVAALAALSTGDSLLLAQYQSRSVTAQFGRRISNLAARVGGVTSPMAGEPWRSLWSPGSMATLLADYGWAVTGDEDLLTAARQMGAAHGRARSLANGRVLSAHRRAA